MRRIVAQTPSRSRDAACPAGQGSVAWGESERFLLTEWHIMGPKDVIRHLFQSNDSMLNTYLSDLSDADLLLRPVSGANHIAWQLGHLIKSEQSLLTAVPGAAVTELPAGWADQYKAA